ncbi:MAG: sulfatase [Planctomycetota bacterium]|jgi:arylsulfatase A-like enzyme|nr:sulfatase [Planctomycetota bacterium]MDP7129209.1 sulfatase [Planctomycetota bacterium]MDP7253079.1 sulfatase [Planctomycetota bacterium]
MKHKRRNLLAFLFLTFLYAPERAMPEPAKRPNILWLYVEDMNAWMGCYGDKLVETPNIDALAKSGVRFEKAFMPAGVCSATRSGIITGTMQTTFGIHNHRSSRNNARNEHSELGMIHLPNGVKTVPELFRDAGYSTFNKGKDDYNFVYDRKKLYNVGDWKQVPAGTPFFGQIQLRGGKARPKSKVMDRAKVPIPPYYPDTEIVRDEIAHHYDCVLHTDAEVGRIVSDLKAAGRFENTVIFFFTDHGMRLNRHKQFLYEGGIHVPLIASWAAGQDKLKPGTVRPDLVSGIDITAASLALAGLKIPSYMEGRDFFAKDYREREFIVAARDRCDFTIEHIRAIRTKQFKYLRNFLTDRPYMQSHYRDGTAFTRSMKQLYADGKLDKVQSAFWAPERASEELYDLDADPHEIANLATNPKYAEELKRHRGILEKWMKDTGDKGQQTESTDSLLQVMYRWGSRCVNPEYAAVREKYGEIKPKPRKKKKKRNK